MTVQRLLAPLLALALLAGSAAASAQNATPTVGSQGYNAVGHPLVGTEVQYLDDDGDEIAVGTVLDGSDPFDDFSQFFTPEEDARHVAVEVEVRSTGDEVEVTPYDFRLHTADGFAYTPGFVNRPEGREDPPELESIEVEEGDETSGVIFYAVPEDAELTRILGQPESERLLVLADLRDQDQGLAKWCINAVPLIGAIRAPPRSRFPEQTNQA